MNLKQYALKDARFREIVGKFPRQRILIVGDVGVDRYTMGAATRLSQEAPVPIVRVTGVRDKLGMAANVADNVKAFGAVPYLTALIGEDRIGDELKDLLKESGISSEHIYAHKSRRTSLKERVIAQSQQVVRVDHESPEPLDKASEEYFCGKLKAVIGAYDGIILEDYAKGLVTDTVARFLVKEARAQKKFVSVDPPSVGREPDVYQGAAMITPNVQEAERLSGVEIKDDASLKKAGEKLLGELEIPTVVITRGKMGMTIFTPNSAPITIPTFARAVYDVSGAGDTVISMLTLATLSGASLEEAAILANFAAGVEVGKQGTATVTVQELEEYMQSHHCLL